jgi:hypothetical protein
MAYTTPFPHICRNFLISKGLRHTDFPDSDAQIGADISITTRTYVEKIA